MKVTAYIKKWIGTKDRWTTSLWVEFDIQDLEEINKLEWVFKIYLSNWEDFMEYNACINPETKKPITIETDEDKYSFAPWNATIKVANPKVCLLKIDVYIDDLVSGMLRVFDIHINEDPSHAQFWQLD